MGYILSQTKVVTTELDNLHHHWIIMQECGVGAISSDGTQAVSAAARGRELRWPRP